jgi:hypothetical protein
MTFEYPVGQELAGYVGEKQNGIGGSFPGVRVGHEMVVFPS